MKIRCSTLIVAVLLAPLTAAAQEPHPDLEPLEVVRIQLEALRDNDRPVPDTGVALAFRFASPGNRAQSGPLPRFAEMIHGRYAEMLNHREARLPPGLVRDDEAIQPVELVARDGRTHRYLFILSRQTEAPYAGCWLTDTVLGDPGQAPEPADTI